MRKASLALGIGVALMGFMGAAGADNVPLPRPAPLPKTGLAAATESAPRPPAAISGAEAPARPPASAVAPPRKPAPVVTAQVVATPAAPAITGDKPGPAVVVGPNGVPFDAKQRSIIDRVNAYLTSVQSLVGDFVQVGPDGSRTEGQFYMQKPGRVRFEYDPPSPVELISDGQSLVVRDRKLATQDFYPLSQTPLRFLLADRIDLLRDANLVAVYADDLFVSLVIEERHVIGGTHRLMLMFGAKDFRLRQWTITDPQGYDTTVALYNLDSSRRPDPSLFTINYERVLQ
ncbi:MAG TPA: outer-membrane lipoprotein carrier protein LolA [Xanthobacteraceae bacterium]|nr:outer-membrane lipoprotein carrier protein LolA [Xanthobacteraceae bacterium]